MLKFDTRRCDEPPRDRYCHARGDVKFFASFVRNAAVWTTSVNLSTDTIKLGFIGNGVTCSIAMADPRWAAGGSTNFLAQEVATGSVYITGGPTLANVAWSQTGGTVALTATNVTVAQDVAGFTTAYWAIGYSNTSTNKYAIFYVDLGGPVGISAGAVSITWNAAGIGTAISS